MTKNLTVGNPAPLILSFTVPLLIGNLFQQLYNIADAFIVGQTLGVEALAAVGCTGSLNFFILGFVWGFTSGTAIITAQRFGASDMPGVRRSFACSIVLCILVTIAFTALSVPLARPMLALLRTPAEIFDDAARYITIIFGGIAATVWYNLCSSMMRAVGDSRTPLYFLSLACVLNIILDYVFILAFHTGVEGAAYATVIAQLVAGLCCIPVIRRRFPMLAAGRGDWNISRKETAEHVKVAFPMGFQMSIIAIGTITLQFALNGLGTIAVAACTAAQKIDSVAGLPLGSFGVSMATYTAQNYGARKIDRILKGVKQCIIMSGSFSIFAGILFILTGRYLAVLFVGSNAEAAELVHVYLSITGACYIFLSLLFIFRNSLQGLGDSVTPTIAGIMELVMRTVAALGLSIPFGFAGICIAGPLAWLGALIPLAIAWILTMKRLGRKALAEKKVR